MRVIYIEVNNIRDYVRNNILKDADIKEIFRKLYSY